MINETVQVIRKVSNAHLSTGNKWGYEAFLFNSKHIALMTQIRSTYSKYGVHYAAQTWVFDPRYGWVDPARSKNLDVTTFESTYSAYKFLRNVCNRLYYEFLRASGAVQVIAPTDCPDWNDLFKEILKNVEIIECHVSPKKKNDWINVLPKSVAKKLGIK